MKKTFLKIKTFFKTFGPGVVTGAAGDDPSEIATMSLTDMQLGKLQQAHVTGIAIIPFGHDRWFPLDVREVLYI